MIQRYFFPLLLLAASAPIDAQQLPHAVLFVTQYPVPVDFGTIGSVFNNHRGDMDLVGRGGDLYVRYPDGTLRNLTREAGYGASGEFQGANAIAVRDPHVHWSGSKAIFSMVVGAPVQLHQQGNYYWQLYEVTGFGVGETVAITRVAGQSADYNNVMPAYLSDGGIVFVSDRPRDGARHLYPQQDEYESAPTNTGLWRLAPAGAPVLMQHSPSGSFDPFVDSFGRVLFSRWDHLLRDQQNDAGTYDTFNWSSEAVDSVRTADTSELFPEPRINGPNINRFVINHFFPWSIRQDGTGEETLNHLGRHELHKYFQRSFTDDSNLSDFEATISGRTNPREALNYLQLHEDRLHPGRYYAVAAPEFGTHNSGQIVRLDASPELNPDDVVLDYVTHPDTRGTADTVNHSGHYRNPIVLADGRILASHASYRGVAGNDGTTENPVPRYLFRLRLLQDGANGYKMAGSALTSGLSRRVRFYSPGVEITYDGPFWELGAAEIVARTVPPAPVAETHVAERDAYSQAGVDEAAFRAFLRDRGLGVVVVRDATSRDDADRQQPFNLRVSGGGRQTPALPTGRVYDIAHSQFVQADMLRGRGVHPGRRPLAQWMHDAAALAANVPNPGGPPGSVRIAADGSVAAFVPARRALAWQSTAPDGTPVVRERYWITLQPGEVRACDGCHGINRTGHGGVPASTQTAQAFVDLLRGWRSLVFADQFEVQD
jgi:hypothetical protein